MADKAELAELERRIQIVEDNLRQLQEQAAAYSGAADEERNAARIADQEAKLEALLSQRAALSAKVRRVRPDLHRSERTKACIFWGWRPDSGQI
jgi:hypothetical protein